jgi:hypothetical protein
MVTTSLPARQAGSIPSRALLINMPAKADKLTTEQRTEAVYRLILDGWTVEQIPLYRMCHNETG